MRSSEGPVTARPFWNPHWRIITVLIALLCAVTSLIVPRLLKMGSFPEMMDDATLVERIDGVQSAAVRETTVFHDGQGSSAPFFSIDVQWTGESGDDAEIADQVAKLILQNDHKIRNYSSLRIAITRGYDLGIGYGRVSRSFTHSPDEWRERVQ